MSNGSDGVTCLSRQVTRNNYLFKLPSRLDVYNMLCITTEKFHMMYVALLRHVGAVIKFLVNSNKNVMLFGPVIYIKL